MSDEQSGDMHAHAHEHADAPQPVFRFEAYADAPSAQAAFAALYPPGSSLEAAVQALALMGAHCKSVGPAQIACRYIEDPHALAGWCWHLALERSATNAIERVRVGLAVLGT